MTPDDIKRICAGIEPCFEPTPGAMAMMLAVAEEAAKEERKAVVCHLWDRAEQYDDELGSGTIEALTKRAAEILDGAHVAAYEHGEFDDLRKRYERAKSLRTAPEGGEKGAPT
jgi:hypothetical protein